MKRNKCKCPICNRYISKSNIKKHENVCQQKYLNLNKEEKQKRVYYDYIYSLIDKDFCKVESGFKCPYCEKVVKSFSGLKHHILCCSSNPNILDELNKYKDTRLSSCKKGRDKKSSYPSWNKGLTKYTDERLKKQGDKLSKRYKCGELTGSFKGKKHTQETKDKLRKAALERGLGGHCYKKVYKLDKYTFDSSFEEILALDLNKNNIKWNKPKRFNYLDDKDKLHTYTADFYLPDYDLYLDPKNDFLINNINPSLGFSDIQKIKWVMEQNHIKVIILNKDELSWEKIKYKINENKNN